VLATGTGGLVGDFGKLAELTRKMAEVSSGAFKRTLFANLAEEGVTQLKMGFRGERDPYGAPWRPIKHRSGRILQDTGRLRNSFTARPTSSGFAVSSNVVYAAAHQYGATITQKARVNRHTRGGRFMSRARAEQRTRGAVRVSFSAARTFTLPRRQMLPEQDTGGIGPIWGPAFEAAGERTVTRLFKR
jgi:phage gpG-like protein